MAFKWVESRLRWFLGRDLYAKTSWLENWAAALSFYNLLCQVPIFIVAITVAGFFLDREYANSLRDVLIQLLPLNSKNNSDEILDSLRGISGAGFTTVAFTAALWTASNFMNQMLKALHFVMGGTFDAWTGAWRRRLKAFVLLVVWIFKMTLNAGALLFIPAATLLLSRIGLPFPALAWGLYQILHFVITFATFFITYRLASNKALPLGLLCQAALIASVGWILMRGIFTSLLPHAWNSGYLAGTITSMMGLLLLAYAVAWVILLGGCWIGRSVNK